MTTGRAPYAQIVDHYEELILSGALEPGAMLPSIRTIAQERGVSHATVEKALRMLHTRGLVHSIHGVGTEVIDQFGSGASVAIGRRIEELRQTTGMTQAALARAVNRSMSWMSQVERGELAVDRLPVLQALANALNVSIVCEIRPGTAMKVHITDDVEDRT